MSEKGWPAIKTWFRERALGFVGELAFKLLCLCLVAWVVGAAG